MEQEMTKAIMEVRKKVSREEWRERILECQSSGLPVRRWCGENGISFGSYYEPFPKKGTRKSEKKRNES